MDDVEIRSLEARVAALEKGKNDIWDRLSKVATTLIPAVIALFGYLITEEIGSAEVAVMEQNARVSQAQLLNQFMPALTSRDSTERILAVNGVTHALTDSVALPLLAVVLQYDSSMSVRNAAREQYDAIMRRPATAQLSSSVMQQLMSDLFSADTEQRKQAAPRLVARLDGNPELLPRMIEYSTDRLRRENVNPNGVYNTVVILEEIDANLLATHRQDVCRFLSAADDVGENTAARANSVRRKLESTGTPCATHSD